MRITLFMVMSIDGVVAFDNQQDIHEYSSKEDHAFFLESVKQYDAVIMGHNSVNGEILKPKFILTRDAEKIPDTANEYYLKGKPDAICRTIEDKGFTNIALLGGPTTNRFFLDADLVDDIFLTVEPIMIGKGLYLNTPKSFIKKWQLIDTRRLNTKGTIVLHFTSNRHIAEEIPQSMLFGKEDTSLSHSVRNAMEENVEYWNERAKIHVDSDYYGIVGGVTNNCLRTHEINELGKINGMKVLHLQCHIGTDSIALAQMGAEVTGLDFSDDAIEIANKLSKVANCSCKFVKGNVYDATRLLGKGLFDMIYISYGSILYLPNLKIWARELMQLLKLGGYVYISEFHPVAALLSDFEPKFVMNYFDSKAKHWNEEGSYVDLDTVVKHNKTCHNDLNVWNWTISEILTSIIDAGFTISFFHEQDGHIEKRYPYLEKRDDNKWYAPEGIPSVPATFTLKAVKK